MEPQVGSAETARTGPIHTERERWGFPCAQLIHPLLDTQNLRMDVKGRDCRSPENRPRWVERGTLHLLQKKIDAYVGGIRVLVPESVSFLEIISLLTVLPVFMLYRSGVQLYKYLFFFYKEAFYGANLFPHSGNV